MKVIRVSKTIPTKRYHDFPNIMNFDQHHDLKKMCLLDIDTHRWASFSLVFLSSTSSIGPKKNKLPAGSYHTAEITKASVHVEAYKRLFANLALMLSGHKKLMTFKN